MEPAKITFYEQPALRQPDLVAAFLGWPDAAQVSTGSISYMIDKLPAVRLAEMKSDDYYDFATVRPTVSIENGIMQPLSMPLNSFYYWINKKSERDVILFTGIEPQMKWNAYVEAIADLAGYYNVHRVYAVGGLYDRIPHTRETRISGLVNNTDLIEVLETSNIELTSYNGPSSIHGLLLSVCAMRRIPALSIWGHVPFYIRAESNPMVCFEIIKKMSAVLGIDVSLADIKKSADSLFTILNRLLYENEQMRNFLRALEDQYDQVGSSPGTEATVAGADQIIKDIEDFLRNQRQDE
jgi:proteasome assembly chaperone (PAC2) family protein